MRHLKLYEDFYSSLTDNGHLNLWATSESDRNEKLISVSEETISTIENIGLNISILNLNKSNGNKIKGIKIQYSDKSKVNAIILYIWQYEDEWFEVELWDLDTDERKFYWCDQLEGLVKCIEDIKLK